MKIKISDYFSHYNGKGSFKKMVEEGRASKTKTDKFKYPVYDASTKNNHIKGYADNFTHEGKFIKMNKGGEAGLSILIEGKVYAAGGSILLKSDKIDLTDLHAFTFSHWVQFYVKGTAQQGVTFNDFKGGEIEFIENLDIMKITTLIAKNNKLKQDMLSQLKLMKKAFIQKANEDVKEYIERGKTDKYIQFKIGDFFEVINGKRGLNECIEIGEASLTYNKDDGFIYPFYSGAIKGDHITGYSKKYNIDKPFIKITTTGRAGISTYGNQKSWLGSSSHGITSDKIKLNHFIALFLTDFLPFFARGTAQPGINFNVYKNEVIAIPTNHKELSKIIEKWNILEPIIIKDLKQNHQFLKSIYQSKQH